MHCSFLLTSWFRALGNLTFNILIILDFNQLDFSHTECSFFFPMNLSEWAQFDLVNPWWMINSIFWIYSCLFSARWCMCAEPPRTVLSATTITPGNKSLIIHIKSSEAETLSHYKVSLFFSDRFHSKLST